MADLIKDINEKHEILQSETKGMISSYAVLFNQDKTTKKYKNMIEYYSYQQLLGGLYMLYNLFGEDFIKNVKVADSAGYNSGISYLDDIFNKSHD